MAIQSRPDEPTVLLTRPAAQSGRFADEVRQRYGDIPIVVSPILAPHFLTPVLPDVRPAALVFTSETGVTAFARLSQIRDADAWCVGARTAQAARREGFRAIDGGGHVHALIAAITAAGVTGPLLYPRGEDQAADLAALLSAAGIPTRDVVVYAQRPQPLTDVALTLFASETPVVLPLFSPRSARLLADAIAKPGRTAPLWVAALSPPIADAARTLRPDRLVIAARPDTEALLDAVQDWLGRTGQP